MCTFYIFYMQYTIQKHSYMRKFIFMIAMMLLSTGLFAQALAPSKTFDNTYVTVSGGGITTNFTTTHEKFFFDGAKDIAKSMRPVAAIEVGKYITPVVGFSVEGQAIFNTTRSNTFVDQSNVVGNLKINLSNLIGGYPGQPRFVEFVAVPGLGWGHDYGNVFYDRNYLTYNAGAEVNFNVADHWQINFKPAAVWNNYNNMLRFDRRNLQLRVLAGVTYKFGKAFSYCPYSVTAAEYNTLQNKVKELQDALAKKPTEVEVIKEVEKEVIVEKATAIQNTYVVMFAQGSYELDADAKTELDKIGENSIVGIIATASPEGGKMYNKILSQKRADAVKAYLENRGVKVESAEGLGVVGKSSNRVAIVKIN